MCCLLVDQPLLLHGDSSCARSPSPCSVAQLLASRLRRIGDQLEKESRVAEERSRETDSCRGGRSELAGRRDHFKSFVCTAIHITVLVLFVTRRRHL